VRKEKESMQYLELKDLMRNEKGCWVGGGGGGGKGEGWSDARREEGSTSTVALRENRFIHKAVSNEGKRERSQQQHRRKETREKKIKMD